MYSLRMARKNTSTDVNVTAFQILEAATNQVGTPSPAKKTKPKKNPAAVALGRLGGKKGGPARAKKLSAKERKDIAKLAARTRWGVDR
jgi:hypothetical protein